MFKKVLFGGYADLRKNKWNFDKIKGVYSEYKVKGVNIEVLLNTLKKNNIQVYNCKYIENKTICITVKLIDEQKFFAISKKLCYNVKKVKNSGKFLWLYKLITNPGIIVGCLLFVLLTSVFSDFVFGFKFVGDGRIYSNLVETQLQEMGVTRLSRFSKIDEKALANTILTENDEFSFVNCKKQGNNLVIELILSESKPHINTTTNKDLVSQYDGVIDKIYLYRGTPLFKEGEQVKKGDVLVGGYVVIKENIVEVNALAVVVIKFNRQVSCVLDEDNDELAKSFVLDSIEENGQVVNIIKEQKNGKYYYTVDIEYKISLYTG